MALKTLMKYLKLSFYFALVLFVITIFFPNLRQPSKYLYPRSGEPEVEKQDIKSRLQLRKTSFMNKGSRLDSLVSLTNTIPRSHKSLPINTYEKKSNSFGIPQRSMEKRTGDDSFGVKFHENIYGTGCPPNPSRPTLRKLFNFWVTVSRLHNITSFLCRGSLIGVVRNSDIIPYDRDIDVCMSHKEFYKVQKLRSPKPFNYRDGRIHVVIQDDFFTKDMEERTRVDCRGRLVTVKTDPCVLIAPGARLITHELFLDVYIHQINGRYTNDTAYGIIHLTKDVFPLKPCIFMGIETKCPRNQTALLLRYYDPDVVTKPHFVCRNKTWIPTSPSAKDKYNLYFTKQIRFPKPIRFPNTYKKKRKSFGIPQRSMEKTTGNNSLV